MYKDIIESVGKDMAELSKKLSVIRNKRAEKAKALESIEILAKEDPNTEYGPIIEKLQEQIEELGQEYDVIDSEKGNKLVAQEAIIMLQAYDDRDNGRLAVQKRICPFPEDCNLVWCCTKDYCSHDVCSNGHTYRMS